MRAEQKKTFLKFAIFPSQKRDGPAPVFIEPELAMKSGTAFIAGKQEAPESLLSERLTIWTLLLSAPTGIRNCIIVGAPGSGKTTLLQHTAALLARRRDMHHPDMLPVFLYLPACAALIESRANFLLGDAVCEQIQKQWQQTAPKQWLEELIAAGQCVILLDGLDAVADQLMRNRVTLWVQQQMRAYPQNRFIVTVRSWSECEALLEQAFVLEICPFNREQIEQYTQQWFRANMARDRWRDVQKGRSRQQYIQEFLQKLHAMPSLRELASNPLHLMLLTLAYHRQQRLPAQQGELYSEIVRVFHEQIKRLAGMQECTISQIQNVLAFLAWSMLQEGKEGFSLNAAQALLAPYEAQHAPSLQAGDFLNMSSICGDVFLGQEKQGYRFTHRTIQEYLAATYAKEHNLEQVLANQIGNSWWHETIHSFCTQADAPSLLQSCLEYPGAPAPILALIGKCLEDGCYFEPSLKARSERVVEEHLEDPDPVKRHIAAEIWLRKRMREMIALEEGIAIDRSLVTGAEYQLFLDAQQLHGHFCQPDHWKTLSVPEGQGREVVLGVRASDARAFC